MKDEYAKKVELACPVCGGKTFQYDSTITDGPATCLLCKRTFSRDELLAANSETLSANMEELQKEAVDDMGKELRKKLKDAFGNSFKPK
jgi:predicted  nucleic acid-binding Zn-ribbon protein